MVRITSGKTKLQRRKKILARAKGFRGSLSTLYRPAKQAVTQALTNSYRGRKEKKRYFRDLWICRINAGCHINHTIYSKLIYGLKKENIILNRKMLAELAIFDIATFTKVVELAVGSK